MVKFEVGFVEELSDKEKNWVMENAKNWMPAPVENFVDVLKKANENEWAEIVEEKKNALGVKELQRTILKGKNGVMEVWNDGNLIYVKRGKFEFPIQEEMKNITKKTNVVAEKTKDVEEKDNTPLDEEKKTNEGGERLVRRAKKKEEVLHYLDEYIKNHDEPTIGGFLRWVKENFQKSYYRPYVFNVIKKNCEFEYTMKGKKKVIILKGVKD